MSRRRLRKLFHNFLLFGWSVAISVMAIALFTPVSFVTDDDREDLLNFWENTPSSQVLGAQTYSGDKLGCPDNKPIIGWIDYSGNKKIVDILPEEKIASGCFVDLQEANEAGFEE